MDAIILDCLIGLGSFGAGFGSIYAAKRLKKTPGDAHQEHMIEIDGKVVLHPTMTARRKQ